MESVRNFFGVTRGREVAAIVIHLNIVVYAATYWMCQPVLPFLIKELNVDQETFGYLQSFFSLSQLIGSPIIGAVSDRHGPKVAMLLSQTGGLLGYALLGTATTATGLFIAQVPQMLMHAMHSAQALVSDSSTTGNRAAALGRLSLSYGVGMVGGTLLGGHLPAAIGLSNTALVAAAVAALALPIDLLLLPAGRPASVTATDKPATSGLDLGAIGRVLSRPAVRELLAVNVLVGFAGTLQHRSLSMIGPDRFGLAPSDLSNVLTVGAVAGVAANTFAVGFLTKRYSDHTIVRAALAALVVAIGAYATAADKYQVIALIGPMTLTSSTLYTVAASAFTTAVPAADSATSIGISHAGRTLSGIVAPLVVGALATRDMFLGIAFTAAASVVVALILASQGSALSRVREPVEKKQA